MKIQIPIIKHETVDLNKQQELDILIRLLQEVYNINYGDWIEDGYLMRTVEYKSAHTWYDNEKIRLSLSIDSSILRILNDIVENKVN